MKSSKSILSALLLLVSVIGCRGDGYRPDCGPWSSSGDWVITYLTYSGGTVTRYTDRLATMSLVLFNDGGVPKLSIQHTSFGAGGYNDDQGMVYGFPPAMITYPHVRV